MPALRELLDAQGRMWSVFEVHPSGEGVVSTRGADATAQGWLCLRTDVERRRILPIPSGWNTLNDAALLRLIDEAGPTGRRKRMGRAETQAQAKTDKK